MTLARLFLLGVMTATLGRAALASEPSPAGNLRRFHHFLLQHWSLEEGLPQVAVGDLAQDRSGFIWVATQDGLARFDGSAFETFDRDHHPGLVGDDIVRLEFDADGTLWVGTRTGLSRYDGTTFERVTPKVGAFGAINGLLAFHGGLLVASDAGLFRYGDGQVDRVEGVSDAPVFSVDHDADGGLFVGLQGRILEMAPARARVFSFAGFANAVVPKQRLKGCGSSWWATTAGLFELGEDGLRRFDALGPRNVNALHCDPSGTLWVGTGNGLYRIRDRRLVEAVDDEARFAHLFVQTFLTARDDALWIGTLNGGLYRLTAGRFVRYSRADGLSFSSVFAVSPRRQGGLWVGGAGGVAVFEDGRFTDLGVRRHLPDATVTTVLEDTAGRLWMGTRSGLAWWNPATASWKRVLNDFVLALAEDTDGTVWAGGAGGVYAFRDGRAQPHVRQANLGRVRALVPTRRHGLVIGTERGVFARAADGTVRRIDADVFPDGRRVGAVTEDRDGDLWIGLLGDGLARFSARDRRWTLFTEHDGLLSNTIYRIVDTGEGSLWFSSNKGVFRVERSELDRVARLKRGIELHDPPLDAPRLAGEVVVSVTGREPGSTRGYCCNGGGSASGAQDRDGILWFPSLDGMVRVDPAESFRPAEAPSIALTGVRVHDVVQATRQRGEASLAASERDLEFFFTAPSFDKPALTRFLFRLDGYDKEWRNAGSRRSASYTNLPSGHYTFRVRAMTGDDVPSANEATWSFVVAPRFSETWWFFGIVAFGSFATAFVVYIVRLRQVERQRARLEQVVTERTAALKTANEALAIANDQLQQLSFTDPLTRLWNRRYLADRIGRDIAQLRRLRLKEGDGDLAILFLLVDIDHFKHINDRWGHDVGDEVLVETARRLRGVARATDHVLRWGGEEFLIVGCFAHAVTGPRMADRIMTALWREPFKTRDGRLLHMTGSMGFSVYPMDGSQFYPMVSDEAQGWQRAINLADQALYHVKRTGRNGWAGFVPDSVAAQEGWKPVEGHLHAEGIAPAVLVDSRKEPAVVDEMTGTA